MKSIEIERSNGNIIINVSKLAEIRIIKVRNKEYPCFIEFNSYALNNHFTCYKTRENQYKDCIRIFKFLDDTSPKNNTLLLKQCNAEEKEE